MKKTILFFTILLFTASLAFAAALSEGFEGTFPPTDWTVIQGPDSPTNDITQSSTEAYSGTYSARFSSYDEASGYDEYLITPQLVTTGGDQTTSFWYRSSSSWGAEVFKVGWSSTGTNVATDFTWSAEIDDAINTDWTQFSKTDLPIGTKYVAIHYYSDYQYRLYVDDVAGPELYVPAYPKPTGLTTTNITTTTADLDWTEAGTATTWEYDYGLTGYGPPAGAGTSTTSKPVNIIGLSANTTYDWYVRADYGSGNYSDWAGAETFTTPCAPVTSYPYTEGFEATVPPDCWSEVRTPASSDGWASFATGYTGKCARFDSYNNSDDNISELITNTLDLSSLSSARLKFVFKNPTGGDFSVLLSTDGGSTYPNEIWSGLTGQTDWLGKTADITAYIGSDVKISFKGTSNWGSGDAYVYLDDVTVEEIPTSPIFSVDPALKDFGTVILGESSAAQTFTVTNTGGGTLTITSVSKTGTDTDQFTLTDLNSYPHDLTAGQSITVDVAFSPTSAGSKSANLSVESNAKVTHTAALSGVGFDPYITSYPYTQNFDSVTPPDLPLDWSKLDDTGSSWTVVETIASNAHSEPNSVKLYNSGETTGNVILISPPTELSTADTRVKFWGKGSTGYQVNVGTMSDKSDAATFSSIEVVEFTATYTQYTVVVTGGGKADTYIAFKHNMTAGYHTMYIDDFTWEEIPTDPVYAIDPISKAFGTVNVGESSADETFTISNDGGGTLTVTGVSITGTDLDQFTLTDLNSYPHDLTAGQSITVDVDFSPTSVGSKTANLSIESNAKVTHTAALTGDGWDPDFGGGGAAQGNYYFANSLASGAPSAPTYSWYANQTGGTNEGTLIPDTDFTSEDDGHTDLMDIFDDASNFTFFGNTYSQMYLSTNGTIGFGVIADAWHSIGPDIIPSADGDDNMIAWCWDDLDYDDTSSPNVNIRISRLSNRTIVTFWQYPIYSYIGPWGYITAQVIIYKDGRVFIMYNDDESTYDQATQNCAIGIENIDGTAGVGYRYNQTGGPIFSSNLALAFGTNENTLPVILSSFTVQFIGNSPVICWTTQSEDNNAGWNIYRGDYRDAFINEDVIQINPELIEGAGTTAQPTDYIFEDQYEVIPGNEYWYILESVDYSGDTFIYGSRSLVIPEEGSTPVLPQLTVLKGNYPNPFNPDTIIEFDIKENENARLSIYNMKGQLIETKIFEAGKHNYTWEASSFGSGVYFYKLESQTYSEIRKMLMIK